MSEKLGGSEEESNQEFLQRMSERLTIPLEYETLSEKIEQERMAHQESLMEEYVAFYFMDRKISEPKDGVGELRRTLRFFKGKRILDYKRESNIRDLPVFAEMVNSITFVMLSNYAQRRRLDCTRYALEAFGGSSEQREALRKSGVWAQIFIRSQEAIGADNEFQNS